jgi:hypothetical protein
MSKKRDRAEFDAVLAQYGESFELNESTGKATVTLSDEAEILLGKAAAKKGIDLPTYLTRVCEHLMDRILDERDAHEAEAEIFLPWSHKEYERRIGDVPAQGAASLDLRQSASTLGAPGDHQAEFLPWSREEYERRKDDVLAQGGVLFDLDQSTGMLKISISPEAEKRLTKDAAKKGMDLDTYVRQLCQQEVDRQLAKERAAKL